MLKCSKQEKKKIVRRVKVTTQFHFISILRSMIANVKTEEMVFSLTHFIWNAQLAKTKQQSNHLIEIFALHQQQDTNNIYGKFKKKKKKRNELKSSSRVCFNDDKEKKYNWITFKMV